MGVSRRVPTLLGRAWGYVVRHPVWAGVTSTLIAAMVIALAVTLVGVTSLVWPGPSHTSIRVFSGSDPIYNQLTAVDAKCGFASFGTGRADSWRCIEGNFIRDPCFTAEEGVQFERVVCPGDPRVPADAVALILSVSDIPTDRGSSIINPGLPWFFLVDSHACYRVQGAGFPSPYGRDTFSCKDIGACTEPTKDGLDYTTDCLKYSTSSTVTHNVITEIWF